VSSYSIGIIARAVRSCGVASCTCARTTSSSGSAFHIHARTRPFARRMSIGTAWLAAHAANRPPGRGAPPMAAFAWPSSIPIARLRARRPEKPNDSVTGTQRAGSASASRRAMPPA